MKIHDAAPHALNNDVVRSMPETGPDGLLAIFLRQFNSILVSVLIIAAMTSLVFTAIKDFCITIFIIGFKGIIGFWQDVKAEALLVAVKKLTENRIRGIQDGTERIVLSEDLVPIAYRELCPGYY